MSGIAVAIGGGAVIGAIASSNASRDAANTQANAANRASGVSQAQYDQTRTDNAPWRQAGSAALGSLTQQLPELTRNFNNSDFVQDPGYQFRMQQGQQALERSAAARGGLDSGATMKSLDEYNQGFASNEYGNAYNRFTSNQSNTFNRLASVAGLGQTANGVNAAAGQANASQVGSNMMGAANAQAAGTVGQANAINGAIGQGMNSWMTNSLINKMGPAPTMPSPGAPSYASPSGGTGYLGVNTNLEPLY